MLDLIARHFSLEELRDLCFELGVNFDELGGQGVRGAARELILYLQRRERLPELLAALRAGRPLVEWPTAAEVATTAPLPTPVPSPGAPSHVGRDSLQTGNNDSSVTALGQGASVVVGQLPKQKKKKKTTP